MREIGELICGRCNHFQRTEGSCKKNRRCNVDHGTLACREYDPNRCIFCGNRSPEQGSCVCEKCNKNGKKYGKFSEDIDKIILEELEEAHSLEKLYNKTKFIKFINSDTSSRLHKKSIKLFKRKDKKTKEDVKKLMSILNKLLQNEEIENYKRIAEDIAILKRQHCDRNEYIEFLKDNYDKIHNPKMYGYYRSLYELIKADSAKNLKDEKVEEFLNAFGDYFKNNKSKFTEEEKTDIRFFAIEALLIENDLEDVEDIINKISKKNLEKDKLRNLSKLEFFLSQKNKKWINNNKEIFDEKTIDLMKKYSKKRKEREEKLKRLERKIRKKSIRGKINTLKESQKNKTLVFPGADGIDNLSSDFDIDGLERKMKKIVKFLKEN